MTHNFQLNIESNTIKFTHTLPQINVQHYNSSVAMKQNVNSGSRHWGAKIGLGVNEHTGRLQWCPGLTNYKFLIIFPVFMFSLTLIVLLLLRVDGNIQARQSQQHQQLQPNQINNYVQKPEALVQQQQYLQQEQTHQSNYLDIYDVNNNTIIENMLNDPLSSSSSSSSSLKFERQPRCLSLKFRLSESQDLEDRDIMHDARTSFLPQTSNTIPLECLENRDFEDNYSAEKYMLRKRLRRTSKREDGLLNSDENSSEEREKGLDYVDSFISTQSSLQMFWNERGTKESIREAQAKTMLKYMDQNVDPCEDFYKFSCGNWERLHPIPKDKAGYDTFEMLRENLDIVLRELLESKDTTTDMTNNQKNNIIQLNTINFNDKSNGEADILPESSGKEQTGQTIITRYIGEEAEGALTEERAAELRESIIRRRNLLGNLLSRYKRQLTHTKRKRLLSFFNYSNGSTKSTSSTDYGVTDAKQKAKYLYQSCINSNLLEKRGIKPLLNLIDSFGGWPVLDESWDNKEFDWLNLTAHLRRYNNDILLVEWVGPDIKNSDENIIQFDQTTLGLPTREYFLQDSNSKYLTAYQQFMTEVMEKLGASRNIAIKTAEELLNFEIQLAAITSPAEQRLNVTKLYKRMTLNQLHKEIPEIDWVRYLRILQDRNVRESEQVVVYATDYMRDLVNLIDKTEDKTVANYLMWRFIRHRINNVDDRFETSKQSFYHSLFGREESPSRWKVCIAQVNTNMGMALGAMFVSKYFDENSKKDTLQMTHELQQAFREILQTTDWLDETTKNLAEFKVNAMSLKIGYPDFILNPTDLDEKYAGIEIEPDKYFENTLNVLLHTTKTEQSKINEPVNKTNWQTAPAIVNAYYSRNKNQIMFPAGILQPPFYHRHFPRALNYGGIGVVVGHELTHGFDDKGRLFDRNGSIHKWWTDAAIKGFDERARCIIEQYSNYTVGEVGIALNGESTQGENIADNGGIRQAFYAYKRWAQNNPDDQIDEHMPGINMTGPQLFFLNFGQVWCGAMRPEAVRNKLNTAIHSPGRFRVIGTLSNSEDFSREFQCPIGSPMNPKHKCSVW